MESQQEHEEFDPYSDLNNANRDIHEDKSKKNNNNQIRPGSQTTQNWAPKYTVKDA